MRFSRRALLLLIGGLGLGGFGLYEASARPPAPAGWKTERWEAGFGSWGQGGYGVAYDLQIPQDYEFTQKCGNAWVSDNAEGVEFAIRLAFRPAEADRRYDFQTYLNEDGARNYDRPTSSLTFGTPAPYAIGREPFSRRDFSLANVEFLQNPGGAPGSGTVTGFWLDGRRLSIIADLREARREQINERIVASITPAPGFGWLHAAAGAIPGLLGC